MKQIHTQTMKTPAGSLTLALVLTASSLLLTAWSADPLFTQCNHVGKYSASDPYARSLREIASAFVEGLEQHPTVRFAIPSAGSGKSLANGLAMCRFDSGVTHKECVSCVAEATAHLRKTCPREKEAITWYDYCMVRYSPRSFYGTVEDGFRVYFPKNETVPDPASFNAKVVGLLKRVSSEAYGNEFWSFATEEADVVVGGRKQKIYSLAQCTKELEPKACKRCLTDILEEFPNCCNGKTAGRVLTASCQFRYELYRFYGA